MRVRPRFCRCWVFARSVRVTFDTGSFTRLSNQMSRGRQVVDRLDVDAELAADQTLGTELLVGQRQQRADAELAVELVERRRAEAPADVAPRADLVADGDSARQRAG